jgi:hypothetical protein
VARIMLLATLAAVAASAGCGSGPEPVEREPATASPPTMYSVGSRAVGLSGGSAQLAAPPVTPLAGWLTPAGVPSPDGRYLAYNTRDELRPDDPALSWSDQGIEPGDLLATPSIRVHDSSTSRDELLADGAFSLAWHPDGRVAYFKGADRDYRAAVHYVGDVLVRATVEAEPEVWSRAQGRYIVVAWAGETLLAYREREGEALDVIAFDGPGQMRVLARDSALGAVSPDGRRAFVEQGPAQGRPSVSVLDVASGRVSATLDLTTVDPAVGTVSYSGDWLGHRVVAPSASGLAVFRVSRVGISLEQALPVGVEQGVAEPRFADAAGRRVAAWTTRGRGGVFLDCDLTSAACEEVVPLPTARGAQGFPPWRRPLYNPSRPQ